MEKQKSSMPGVTKKSFTGLKVAIGVVVGFLLGTAVFLPGQFLKGDIASETIVIEDADGDKVVVTDLDDALVVLEEVRQKREQEITAGVKKIRELEEQLETKGIDAEVTAAIESAKQETLVAEVAKSKAEKELAEVQKAQLDFEIRMQVIDAMKVALERPFSEGAGVVSIRGVKERIAAEGYSGSSADAWNVAMAALLSHVEKMGLDHPLRKEIENARISFLGSLNENDLIDTPNIGKVGTWTALGNGAYKSDISLTIEDSPLREMRLWASEPIRPDKEISIYLDGEMVPATIVLGENDYLATIIFPNDVFVGNVMRSLELRGMFLNSDGAVGVYDIDSHTGRVFLDTRSHDSFNVGAEDLSSF